MKFSRYTSNGCGSSRTPLTQAEYMMLDKSFLQYHKDIRATIKKPWKFEIDRRDRVEMMWYHVIGFKGGVLIEFFAEQSYYIDEHGIPATTEDLRNIVIDSHKHLQTSFAERLKEYIIFPPIEDISPDTIEHTVHQLRELFPD